MLRRSVLEFCALGWVNSCLSASTGAGCAENRKSDGETIQPQGEDSET